MIALDTIFLLELVYKPSEENMTDFGLLLLTLP